MLGGTGDEGCKKKGTLTFPLVFVRVCSVYVKHGPPTCRLEMKHALFLRSFAPFRALLTVTFDMGRRRRLVKTAISGVKIIFFGNSAPSREIDGDGEKVTFSSPGVDHVRGNVETCALGTE